MMASDMYHSKSKTRSWFDLNPDAEMVWVSIPQKVRPVRGASGALKLWAAGMLTLPT